MKPDARRSCHRLRSATPLAALAASLLLAGASAADHPGGVAPQERGIGAQESWRAQDTALVVLGDDTVTVEVARTADERARGLMYRTEVPEGTGMLFVFSEPSVHSFWMKNTYVALDIAYIDDQGRITDILPMEPRTTEGYDSSGPVLFALEVRQGWFGQHGVEVGDLADIRFRQAPR